MLFCLWTLIFSITFVESKSLYKIPKLYESSLCISPAGKLLVRFEENESSNRWETAKYELEFLSQKRLVSFGFFNREDFEKFYYRYKVAVSNLKKEEESVLSHEKPKSKSLDSFFMIRTNYLLCRGEYNLKIDFFDDQDNQILSEFNEVNFKVIRCETTRALEIYIENGTLFMSSRKANWDDDNLDTVLVNGTYVEAEPIRDDEAFAELFE